MQPHDFDPLIEFVDAHTTFVVIGHEEPDGDCLYSQLALASLIEARGKQACLVSPGPFLRPEISRLEGKFATSVSECPRRPEAALIVDCSTPNRIGRIADEIVDLPVAVIDHHAAGEEFGDVRCIDSTAPSVTFLIHRLMLHLDVTPSPTQADWLLFGLCTDTGYFRHLGGGTHMVFDTVARLVEAGASPKETYYRMFGNRSFTSRVLLGRLLSRTELHCDGRVLVSWETLEDLKEFGSEHRDSDTLYRELQAVSGCEVVLFVRAEGPGSCSVGLRSLERVDVGSIARAMGGGGHKNASGYNAEGSVETVRARALAEVSRVL